MNAQAQELQSMMAFFTLAESRDLLPKAPEKAAAGILPRGRAPLQARPSQEAAEREFTRF